MNVMKLKSTIITLLLMCGISSNAQTNLCLLNNISEYYGQSVFICVIDYDERYSAIMEECVNNTLLEKKNGMYKKAQYTSSYTDIETGYKFGLVKKFYIKELPNYLEGRFYDLIGECLVDGKEYVRLSQVEGKKQCVFILPKEFFSPNMLNKYTFSTQDVLDFFSELKERYAYIDLKQADMSIRSITSPLQCFNHETFYHKSILTLDFPMTYMYKKYSPIEWEGYDFKIMPYFKILINNQHTAIGIPTISKMVEKHALLSKSDIDSIKKIEANYLDSIKRNFNEYTNFQPNYNQNAENSYTHMIGQEIMYCGKDTSKYKYGEVYIVKYSIPNNTGAGLYDQLAISNIRTGEIDTIARRVMGVELNHRWVVCSHLNAEKKAYTGKKFIYVGLNQIGLYRWDDKKSNGLSLADSSIWVCTDVQVVPQNSEWGEKGSPVVMVMNNTEYGTYYCYNEPQSIGSPSFHDFFISKERHDEIQQEKKEKAKQHLDAMIEKYGKTYGKIVAEGKVRIGMTKEMCRDAWGEPTDINTTIGSYGTHEQWVYGEYDASYLYFENGKLTTIQN